MCGIAALFNFQGDSISAEYVTKFNLLVKDIAHRGPDELNTLQVSSNLLVGHTRLSINGINNGSQPFINNESVSCVNGEIYNYKHLRETHSKSKFKTNSDCEVLAIVGNNPKLMHTIHGMYSYLHYDKIEKRLYFGRDAYGEKPLYYSLFDGHILICSEQRPIIKFLGLSIADVCPHSVSEYMLLGYTCKERTLFSSVKSALNNYIYTVAINENLKKEEIDRPRISPENVGSIFNTQVENSINSEVPLSLALSGGIDSTYLACKLRNRIRTAYTVGYASSGGSDEVDEARAIAQSTGIEHKSIILSDPDIPILFKRQVRAKDAPILDFAGIGYYSIFEAVSSDHFKVCLLGHGGDELSLNYDWLHNSYIHNKERSKRVFYETLHDFRVYAKNNKNIFIKDISETFHLSQYPLELLSVQSDYQFTLYNAISYWLEPNSLRMGDSLSMHHSVEARHPLLATEMFTSDESIYDTFLANKKHLKKYILSFDETLIQKKKKHFSQPYMHYYQLIHPHSRRCSILKDLNIFNQNFLESFYLSKDFTPNPQTYYYFAKLATLDYWLQANV